MRFPHVPVLSVSSDDTRYARYYDLLGRFLHIRIAVFARRHNMIFYILREIKAYILIFILCWHSYKNYLNKIDARNKSGVFLQLVREDKKKD